MKTAYSTDDKNKYLMSENTIIRKGLREMNDFLSEFIDHLKEKKMVTMSSIGYKYGNNGKLKKTKEQKLKRLNAESRNYEVMLSNLLEEHIKYKSRLQQVTDPKFVLELKRETSDSHEYISSFSRHLRSLKDDQFKREK